MANIHAIAALHRSGHSNRHIARVLGYSPRNSRQHVAQLQNQPNPPTGSGESRDASALSSSAGPPSSCAPHRQQILTWLNAGLSIKRIHQDLTAEHDYRGSYDSVWRFVSKIQGNSPLPFRRIETAPGEELQIDFGTAAPIVGPDGKSRRPWMLRLVLSHSRKAYSEVVYRQTTDHFIAVIENALEYFGGAARRLLIDNLKAAVATGLRISEAIHLRANDIDSRRMVIHVHEGIVLLALDREPRFLLGTVHANRPFGAGLWHLGIELTEILDPQPGSAADQLMPLVPHLLP